VPSIYIHTGLHDDYHRPSDDVEKINVEGIRLITGYLLEKVEELADTETLPGFRNESRMDTPFTQRRVERPLPPLASRLNFTTEAVPGEPNKLQINRVLSSDSLVAVGDRIVAVNQLPVENPAMLETMALRTGSVLPLTIERPGVEEKLEVEVQLSGNPVHLGLSWREDPVEPQTVYITRVVPHSPAALAGFQVNDRIYSVEGNQFAGRDELLSRVQQLLAENTPRIRFEVETRGIVRQVEVPLTPIHAPGSDATL
jgi:S1-C subfamily serine protease